MNAIIKAIKKNRKILTLRNILTTLTHAPFSIIRIYEINSFVMSYWQAIKNANFYMLNFYRITLR